MDGELKSSSIIGIDPGSSGGIAVYRDGILTAHKMPVTERDLWLLIAESEPGIAFIEKVNAGPKMGSSASFKFGRNVGLLHAFVLAAGLRLEYVTPQKWQREFGLIVSGRGLGQSDTEKKNRNKARAQELHPELKITHAIADAILICEYGRNDVSRKVGAA